MTCSMTGFARVEREYEFGRLSWEMRSVNHRFLDASLKLPSSLQFLEIELRQRLKDAIARGRVTCAATAVLDPAAAAPRLEQGRLGQKQGNDQLFLLAARQGLGVADLARVQVVES